jgi:hypothetical protein
MDTLLSPFHEIDLAITIFFNAIRTHMRSRLIAAVIAILAWATTARCQHNVLLSWLASPDAAANPSLTYNVYRSSTCAGTFSILNSSPIANTNYLDTSVLAGSYCYQVTSLLSGIEGSPSNQAAVVTAPLTLRQQDSCSHKGKLLVWLRCARAASESHPKKSSSKP